MNRVLISGCLISTTEQAAGQKTVLIVRLRVTEWFKGEPKSFPVELKAFRDHEVIKAIRPGTMVEIEGRVSGREAGEGKYSGRVFQDILLDRIQEA